MCFSGAVLLHPGCRICVRTCVQCVCTCARVCMHVQCVCAMCVHTCTMYVHTCTMHVLGVTCCLVGSAFALRGLHPHTLQTWRHGRDLICLVVPAGRCQVEKQRERPGVHSRHPLTRTRRPVQGRSSLSDGASDFMGHLPAGAAVSDLWPREGYLLSMGRGNQWPIHTKRPWAAGTHQPWTAMP